MARLRRAGCEAAGLEGVSPALRAGASNFSLRGQRKVTKRKATPANPTATRLPLPLPLGGLEGESSDVPCLSPFVLFLYYGGYFHLSILLIAYSNVV